MTEVDGSITFLLSQLANVRPSFRNASIAKVQQLSGGAINRNDRLQLQLDDGSLSDLVMRRGRGSPVPGTLRREQEFQLVQLMFRAGVPVPEPVAMVEADQTLASFFHWCEGITDPRLILKSFGSLPEQPLEDLSGQLGKVLGAIHSEKMASCLNNEHAPLFGERPFNGISASIQTLQEGFNQVQSPPSYLKFALERICEEASRFTNKRPAVLCHNDFRLGNLMLSLPSVSEVKGAEPIANQIRSSSHGLFKAVLDWEFANWGDPMSDLGWLTAPCWRFGGPHPVAGFLPLEPLLVGYRSSMPSFDEAWITELSFWQRFAHLRWAIIASQQGERALSTKDETLELMITGLMTASIVQPVVEHYLGRAIESFPTPRYRPVSHIRPDKARALAHLPEFNTLLREAWRLLRQEVAQSDQVTGRLKYQVLVIANALRLAMASQALPSEEVRQKVSEGEELSRIELELAHDLALWSFQP